MKKDQKKKTIKAGAPPKGAPAFYYIKSFQNGREKYFTKGGKEVDEKTVLTSKKKVYLLQNTVQKNAAGELKTKKVLVDKKQVKKIKSGKKVKDPLKKQKFVILNTPCMGYDVTSKFLQALDDNKKVYLKTFDTSYQFSKNSAPKFVMFFNEIHSKFFDLFRKQLNSPVLFVGHTEFKLNSIFDFDDLDITFAGGDFEGMEFKELSKEERDEIGNVKGATIQKTLRVFKKFVAEKSRSYFGL